MVSQRQQPQQEYRLQELGDFLRTRRARLMPEDVGLPRGTRRKTPGLRRAEVAQMVGVSVDWYTWLEQGRSILIALLTWLTNTVCKLSSARPPLPRPPG